MRLRRLVLRSTLILLRPLRFALLTRLSRFTSFTRLARLTRFTCFARLSWLTRLACFVRSALVARLSASARVTTSTMRVRVMLVPLVLLAMATMARAFVVMMLMPAFTLRGLMIVPVG